MTEIAIHNDGKGKWKSFSASLFDTDDIDFSYIRGSGETEQEAIDNFKKEFANAFDKLLTIISDLNGNFEIVPVDWQGKKIKI